ncbi:hypothetical protein HNY73_011595, partial [Argiope bruennichi]
YKKYERDLVEMQRGS